MVLDVCSMTLKMMLSAYYNV